MNLISIRSMQSLLPTLTLLKQDCDISNYKIKPQIESGTEHYTAGFAKG